MKYIAILFVVVLQCYAILCLPADLIKGAPSDVKLAAAENLAKNLNEAIFDRRHESQPKPSTGKAQKDFLKEKTMDTVAVKIDTHGDLTVAANIKTRDTTNYIRNSQSFRTQDFGINARDSLTIMELVRQDPVFGQSKVNIVESGTPAQTAQENARQHAEMKIIASTDQHQTSNLGKRDSVIGISKDACQRCQPEIKQAGISQYTGVKEENSGLAAAGVRNFATPQEINQDLPLNKLTFVPSKDRRFSAGDVRPSDSGVMTPVQPNQNYATLSNIGSPSASRRSSLVPPAQNGGVGEGGDSEASQIVSRRSSTSSASSNRQAPDRRASLQGIYSTGGGGASTSSGQNLGRRGSIQITNPRPKVKGLTRSKSGSRKA